MPWFNTQPRRPRNESETWFMQIYLLEQTESVVPTGDNWLGQREIIALHRMRFAKRRADWRLGRWTAKRALAACLKLPDSIPALAEVEIIAGSSGAPEAFRANAPLPVTISLSHRAGTAICSVVRGNARMGCDMELIEAHSQAFVTDYFTAEEQTLIAHTSAAEKPRIITLLWSAKESASKALRQGLRLDTRWLSVTKMVGTWEMHGWNPLHVRYRDGRMFQGWWQGNDWLLRTVVADPAPKPPILLEPSIPIQVGSGIVTTEVPQPGITATDLRQAGRCDATALTLRHTA